MITGWLVGLFRRKQVAKIVTQVAIRNRVTGAAIFTAEVEVGEDADLSRKLGLAVRAAHKAKADLRDADLRKAYLADADLREVNLHGADLSKASLVNALLWNAGLCNANLHNADLTGADLRDANLRGTDLRNTGLCHADLSYADLSGADLSGADLRRADLSGACVTDANLTGTDLEDAPAIPDIHARVYAAASQPGALDISVTHSGTAHSHAGWVVVLAGAAGLAVEERIGTSAAAAAIYLASDPERWQTERLPDFYGNDNDEALTDMRRLAGVRDAPEHGGDKG